MEKRLQNLKKQQDIITQFVIDRLLEDDPKDLWCRIPFDEVRKSLFYVPNCPSLRLRDMKAFYAVSQHFEERFKVEIQQTFSAKSKYMVAFQRNINYPYLVKKKEIYFFNYDDWVQLAISSGDLDAFADGIEFRDLLDKDD